jgi:LacI family transcriptional regulator
LVCVRDITPKLSTVEQPSYEMGVEVISLLLEEMQRNKENKLNLR